MKTLFDFSEEISTSNCVIEARNSLVVLGNCPVRPLNELQFWTHWGLQEELSVDIVAADPSIRVGRMVRHKQSGSDTVDDYLIVQLYDTIICEIVHYQSMSDDYNFYFCGHRFAAL